MTLRRTILLAHVCIMHPEDLFLEGRAENTTSHLPVQQSTVRRKTQPREVACEMKVAAILYRTILDSGSIQSASVHFKSQNTLEVTHSPWYALTDRFQRSSNFTCKESPFDQNSFWTIMFRSLVIFLWICSIGAFQYSAKNCYYAVNKSRGHELCAYNRVSLSSRF